MIAHSNDDRVPCVGVWLYVQSVPGGEAMGNGAYQRRGTAFPSQAYSRRLITGNGGGDTYREYLQKGGLSFYEGKCKKGGFVRL